MFGASFFTHNQLMKYTAVFGTLFNDIQIQRYDKSGVVTQTLTVPISYGPRSSAITREISDPTFKRPAAMTLPRMSYEITSMNYDPNRKLGSLNKITNTQNPSLVNRVGRTSAFIPVPYEVVFSLSIKIQNEMDGFQIVEQIFPYFTPDFTPRIRLIESLDYEVDCPIVISSVNMTDNYEGRIEDTRREIEWRIDFIMKIQFVGPVATPKIIKFANIPLYTTERNLVDNLPAETVTIQPGLTIDGLPTTSPYETVPYQQISATDNYDYVVNIVLGDATIDGQAALGMMDFTTVLNSSYVPLLL